MAAGRLAVDEGDVVLLQELDELAAGGDEPVLGPAIDIDVGELLLGHGEDQLERVERVGVLGLDEEFALGRALGLRPEAFDLDVFVGGVGGLVLPRRRSWPERSRSPAPLAKERAPEWLPIEQ